MSRQCCSGPVWASRAFTSPGSPSACPTRSRSILRATADRLISPGTTTPSDGWQSSSTRSRAKWMPPHSSVTRSEPPCGATLGAQHPNWLRALVLVDGGFVSGTDRARFGLPDTPDREVLLDYVSHAKSDHASWEDAFAELREAFGGAWPAHAGAACARPVLGAGRPCSRARLDRELAPQCSAHWESTTRSHARDESGLARVPTLVIAAGRTRYHEPKREAWQRFAAAACLRSSSTCDQQVGHHLLLESPDIYVPLITRWPRGRPDTLSRCHASSGTRTSSGKGISPAAAAISAGTGAFEGLPYSNAVRIGKGNEGKTSPEELLARRTPAASPPRSRASSRAPVAARTPRRRRRTSSWTRSRAKGI